MKELESIFLGHHRSLFAAALAITRNTAAAEDVVHEALLAVASLQDAPRDMAAYLYRVVRNKALHQVQLDKRHAGLTGDDEDYLVADASSPEQAVLLQQVKMQIRKLGQDEQQVLILKLFEDMTLDEIARIMETSPNTVASWYRRGLEKLKTLIGE